MIKIKALENFSALAQETRLDIFRLLVRQAPEGLAAGDIARRLKVPHNTLSTHLAILSRAKLITFKRKGRLVVYQISFDQLSKLVLYLVEDCCQGRPELCAPMIESLKVCGRGQASECGLAGNT